MQEQEMPIIMVINKSLITFYKEWHHLFGVVMEGYSAISSGDSSSAISSGAAIVGTGFSLALLHPYGGYAGAALGYGAFLRYQINDIYKDLSTIEQIQSDLNMLTGYLDLLQRKNKQCRDLIDKYKCECAK